VVILLICAIRFLRDRMPGKNDSRRSINMNNSSPEISWIVLVRCNNNNNNNKRFLSHMTSHMSGVVEAGDLTCVTPYKN